jgi:methionine sulfoxide reductase heme-binding subunit
MTTVNPAHYLWWLVSRASGIVAIALISLSVLVGLAMAVRLVPARHKRSAAALHEHMAMVALVAIAVHGAALLGDGWLRPGLAGITIPFALHYRPAFTGAGIVAGYLALLLGPSFYVRRRLGARTWRRLHRATPLVWVLAAVHTLGSGSDAASLWLRCLVLAPVVPLAYLLVLRVLGAPRRGSPVRPAPDGLAARPAPHGPAARSAPHGPAARPARPHPVRRLTTVPVDDPG